MNTTTQQPTAMPAWPGAALAEATARKLGDLYGKAVQQTWQEAWQASLTSSAMIMQEYVTRAWLETSQACLKALTENAAQLQQKAWQEILNTHQQAASILAQDMGQAVTEATRGAADAARGAAGAGAKAMQDGAKVMQESAKAAQESAGAAGRASR